MFSADFRQKYCNDYWMKIRRQPAWYREIWVKLRYSEKRTSEKIQVRAVSRIRLVMCAGIPTCVPRWKHLVVYVRSVVVVAIDEWLFSVGSSSREKANKTGDTLRTHRVSLVSRSVLSNTHMWKATTTGAYEVCRHWTNALKTDYHLQQTLLGEKPMWVRSKDTSE